MKTLIKLVAVLLVVCVALYLAGVRPAPLEWWVDEVLLQNRAVATIVQSVGDLFGGGDSASASHNAGEDAAKSVRVIDESQIAAELAAGIKRFEETITVQFNSPYDDVESEAMSRYMLSQVEGAFAAIRKDYPEIFWMSLGTYDLQWESASGEDHVTLYLQMKYSCSSTEAAARELRIDEAVDGILAAARDEPYEAILYFHDWIVNNTVYATEIVENENMEGHESAFNIDGVFLDGLAVCEGYTKAYKLLCDRAGIPCVIVFGDADGENHGWNYVQLEGSWYLVDCTWDDPVSSVDVLIWDYFLKGSESLVGGERIADIYTNDGGAYPVLARHAYVAQGVEEEVDGARLSDIYVDASVYQLFEDGPNTARGETVAAFEAGGGSAPYRYSLTDGVADNALFEIDALTGELRVAVDRLEEGGYTIEIAVSDSRGYAAVASLSFSVEPPIERYGDDRGRNGWVA